MTDKDYPRGTSPLAGESPFGLIVSTVLLAVSVLGLLAAMIASFFTPDLGPTLTALMILTAIAILGYIYAFMTRRSHLRRLRNGEVIVREPWSGGDLLPPG